MKKTNLKEAIVFVLLLIAGVILFLLGHSTGTAIRGRTAFGGELLLAGLPMLVYYFIIPIVKDMAADIVQLLREAEYEDYEEDEYEENYSFGNLLRESFIGPMQDIGRVFGRLKLKLQRKRHAPRRLRDDNVFDAYVTRQ